MVFGFIYENQKNNIHATTTNFMKKNPLRIILGILIIITSIVSIFYFSFFALNIHEVTILKWLPLISTFVGFYYAGLMTRKVNIKYLFFLFFSFIIFIPFAFFYFPLIIYLLFFAIWALSLHRNEIKKKIKVVFSIAGILIFAFFLFNQPLIVKKKGFVIREDGSLFNAKVIWDFNKSKPKTLPKESFINSKNEEVKLTAFKDKIIYVSFWATWCGICLSEKPMLEKLKEDFKDSNQVIFVDISLDKDKMLWKSYLEKYNPKGIQLISQNESLTRKNYGLQGIPNHLIVNNLKEYKNLRYILEARKYLENENILDEWIKKE